MSSININNKKIDTTNKSVLDVLIESVKDIPLTVVDIAKLENMLIEQLKTEKDKLRI